MKGTGDKTRQIDQFFIPFIPFIPVKILLMKVQILFFGATADEVGEREMEISLEKDATAKTAFDELLEKFPNLARHKLLFAVNQEYSNGDEIIREGDELAVFTAVSGG